MGSSGVDSQDNREPPPSKNDQRPSTSKDVDSDRPLKKARYVWQIKGKHHLKHRGSKHQNRRPEKHLVVSGKRPPGNGGCRGNRDHSSNHFCQPDVVESGHQPPQRCRYKPGQLDVHEELASIPPPPNMGEVVLQCFQAFVDSVSHANCRLRRWQTKQVAKGIVDNTINKVLEEMGLVPLPVGSEDNANETKTDSEQRLENEAVLMAIQSHGLQRTEQSEPTNSSPAVQSGCSCVLPRHVSDIAVLSRLDPFCSSDIVVAPTCCHSSPNLAAHINLSSSDSSCDSDVLDSRPEGEKKLEDNNNDENCTNWTPMDFLDQAVSVAISEKGLSMYDDN